MEQRPVLYKLTSVYASKDEERRSIVDTVEVGQESYVYWSGRVIIAPVGDLSTTGGALPPWRGVWVTMNECTPQ